MASCPNFGTGTTLSTLSCVNNVSCTYDITFDVNGNPSATYSNFSLPVILGYDSSVIAGRVCIPSLTVFQTGFTTISSTVNSTLSNAIT